MKKNKMGFMLVETLIVSTLVSTILVVLFVQFNNIVKNFSKDFHYNNVSELYATQNIKKFIMLDNNGEFYTNLKAFLNESITANNDFYLKIIPNCSNNNLNAYRTSDCEKFSKITEFYGVKQILFTMEYVDLKDSDYTSLDSPNFVKFIKSINGNKNIKINENNELTYDYRIIIEFENNRYATLKVEG